MECVNQFFKGELILKSASHAFLTVISNTASTKMGDFRPISCVILIIYKFMTKILADRIGKISSDLISPNHIAFREGRVILDNTMLADEMIYRFGGKRTPNRCCLSIDLKKVFDMLK